MIQMEQVRFAHHDRPALLDGFDLEVAPGATVVLQGPSGGGKSTVLRLATGAIPRLQGGRLGGTVRIDGKDPARVPVRDLPTLVGHVPQDPETAFVARTLDAEFRGVLANIGTPRRDAMHRIDEVVAEFALDGLMHRDVATLSGGEAARGALAAAVVADPTTLVLDEPTGQLDVAGAAELGRTLRALAAHGRAILVAAHDPHPFTHAHTVRLETAAVVEGARVESGAPPRGPPSLIVEGATLRHGSGGGVDGLDLAVAPGEVVVLTGANGAGKTTALHLMCGVASPDEGRVLLRGDDPRDLSPLELARRVGIAFQHPAWHITQDTVREEISLTCRRLGRRLDMDAALRDAGLAHRAQAHPWDLSGGERQRLAVATATAHDPDVLLLDEPTRGLDPQGLDRFNALLARRTRAGQATVIATHHPLVIGMAHRVIHLDAGRVSHETPHLTMGVRR